MPPQASEDQPVERLTQMLKALPDPCDKDPLDHNKDDVDSVGWSVPTPLGSMNDAPATGTTF